MPSQEPPNDLLVLLGVVVFLTMPAILWSMAMRDLRATAAWKCLPRLVTASVALAGLFLLAALGTGSLAGSPPIVRADAWLAGIPKLLLLIAIISSVCAWILTQCFSERNASFRPIVRWVFKHAPPQPEPIGGRGPFSRRLFLRRTNRDRRT